MPDEHDQNFQRFYALLDDLFEKPNDLESLERADAAARAILSEVAAHPAHAALFADPPREIDALRAWAGQAFDALDGLFAESRDVDAHPDRKARVRIEAMAELAFGAVRVVKGLAVCHAYLADAKAEGAARAALHVGLLLGGMDGRIKPLGRRLGARGGRPRKRDRRLADFERLRTQHPALKAEAIDTMVAEEEGADFLTVSRSRRRASAERPGKKRAAKT